MRDCVAKGRLDHEREKNGRALLTEEKVREIRTRYANGEGSYRTLSLEYGVSKSTISYVLKGDTWEDQSFLPLNKTLLERSVRGEDIPNSKLKTSDIIAIREAYARHECTQAALAKKHGVSENAIRCIIKRITWKHIA